MIKDLVHASPVQDGAPNGQLTAEEPEEIEALKADISRLINITTDLVNENEKFRGWLSGRDKFIVDQGLWMAFVDQLPALSSPNDEGKAE